MPQLYSQALFFFFYKVCDIYLFTGGQRSLCMLEPMCGVQRTTFAGQFPLSAMWGSRTYEGQFPPSAMWGSRTYVGQFPPSTMWGSRTYMRVSSLKNCEE